MGKFIADIVAAIWEWINKRKAVEDYTSWRYNYGERRDIRLSAGCPDCSDDSVPTTTEQVPKSESKDGK